MLGGGGGGDQVGRQQLGLLALEDIQSAMPGASRTSKLGL